MALKWVDFVAQIQSSILLDPDEDNWKFEQVHTYLAWAVDRFTAHTARPMRKTLQHGDPRQPSGAYDFSVDTEFEIPDNLYEPLSTTGRLYIESPSGDKWFLDPLTNTPGLSPSNRTHNWFWETPQGTIVLPRPVGVNNTLVIEYFAYYDIPDPTDDTALVQIPRWAYKAVASLAGAYALEAFAVQSATIDRWKDRMDSGNPEHNALRKQQEYLYNLYHQEISRVPVQDRVNFYRTYKS